RPVRGAGISTLALSVMTSTIGWCSFTASPALTIQRTISPSATPSPMSGSFTSNAMISSGALAQEVETADLGLALVQARAALRERAPLLGALTLELFVHRLAGPAVRHHEAPRIAQVAHERDAHNAGDWRISSPHVPSGR